MSSSRHSLKKRRMLLIMGLIVRVGQPLLGFTIKTCVMHVALCCVSECFLRVSVYADDLVVRPSSSLRYCFDSLFVFSSGYCRSSSMACILR